MDWFLPGYKAGGPIRSVANIVAALSEYYDFYIVTRNTDLVGDTPYQGIETNKWLNKFGTNIFYISSDSYSKEKIKDLIGERNYHVMYLNSLYSSQYALTPLRIQKKFYPNLKTVLAPRGMLGEGALQTKSLKKSVFIKTTKFFNFFKGITWHATTEDEKNTIQKTFGEKATILVGKPISIPVQFNSSSKIEKESSKARFFFIGRVSEHKNITFTLEQLAKHKPEGEIVFDIFGAAEEPEYLKKIENLTQQLPDNIRVNYKGPVPNEELKRKLQSEYHFLLFPTKGESFSHSIVDSWNSGCPVLVSDQTPWLNLNQKGIGWNFKLDDSNEMINAVKEAVKLNQEEFNNLSKNCIEFYNQTVCSEEITLKNKRIFE